VVGEKRVYVGQPEATVTRTLLIFYTHSFSMAKMVTRTRLNIAFISTLHSYSISFLGVGGDVSRLTKGIPSSHFCSSHYTYIYALDIPDV